MHLSVHVNYVNCTNRRGTIRVEIKRTTIIFVALQFVVHKKQCTQYNSSQFICIPMMNILLFYECFSGHNGISTVSIALDQHFIVCQVTECLSKNTFMWKIQELGIKGGMQKYPANVGLCLKGITPLGKFMEIQPILLC